MGLFGCFGTKAIKNDDSKSGRSGTPPRGGGKPKDGPGNDDSGKAQPLHVIQQTELDESMQKVRAEVQPWDDKAIFMVKQLQEALRNHGRVDLMKKSSDGSFVAVKRMPTTWITSGPKEFSALYPTAAEKPWLDMGLVRYLNGIEFPYVCKLHGVFKNSEETFVVAQFCTEGDLFGWCDRPELPFPGQEREQVMLPLVVQIFAAVKYLHDMGVAHRDISLENVLLTKDDGKNQIKIIDFGMATLARTIRREVRGKQSYQAPEMHTEPEHDAFLSDAFAIGVMVFAMAAQDYPWTSTKRNACQMFEYVSTFGLPRFLEKRKLRRAPTMTLSKVFSLSFVSVIDGLLQVEPKKRACLGENCYNGKTRTNIWKCAWFETQGIPAWSPKYAA